MDMEGIIPPPRFSRTSVPLSWDPAAECSWSLHLRNRTVEMDFEVLGPLVFMYKYTAGSPLHYFVLFRFFERLHYFVLFRFFERQGKLEGQKLVSEDAESDDSAMKV